MKPLHWGGRARERVRYSRGGGRGKKRHIPWEHSAGKVDHRAEEGRLEQREVGKKWIGSVKDQSLFFPTVPERLKTKERRNNFRWVLTECDLLPWKRRKKCGLRWFPRQLCGSSKDDANHLWVTSSIHHLCYSSNVQPRPSGKTNHAHTVCRSLWAVSHCGWKLSKFHMWKAENLLPERATLSDQAICDSVMTGCWKCAGWQAQNSILVSLSHVLCLKTTICGDIQMYTHLTDTPAYTLIDTWWLAAAHCLNFFFRLPVKADYQRQSSSKQTAES